jgi:hypothetical protein
MQNSEFKMQTACVVNLDERRDAFTQFFADPYWLNPAF